jgi:MOSC domain-containing protein YiiM
MSGISTVWRGSVAHLHLTARASAPMQARDALELVAGQGIVGDRYKDGVGFYSNKPEEGRQVTLFEVETLEALKRDHDIDFAPHEHRRNVTTLGVPLNHLVGRRFRVGVVVLEATRLSTPCQHIVDVTGKEVFKPLINRSGLNCKILVGGTIRVGDAIEPA